MDGQNENMVVNREVGLGEWMITILLTSLPVIGLIMLFVWAFGDNTPKCKANYAKASLLWMVIVIGIAVFFFGSIAGFVSQANY